MEKPDVRLDFLQQSIARHVARHCNGGGKAFRVRAAVAFDHHTVQPRNTPPLTLRGSIFSRRKLKALRANT
jgi:hypothetical protein